MRRHDAAMHRHCIRCCLVLGTGCDTLVVPMRAIGFLIYEGGTGKAGGGVYVYI